MGYIGRGRGGGMRGHEIGGGLIPDSLSFRLPYFSALTFNFFFPFSTLSFSSASPCFSEDCNWG
jgi:hypothetical protein